MSLVLDTGALIAIERNDRALWTALKRAAIRMEDVVVPSTVIAQVWRAVPRQARLAQVLQHCVVASFDLMARDIGVLCGRARSADICDAHVALVASRVGGELYTSDPGDMKALLGMLAGHNATIVRC